MNCFERVGMKVPAKRGGKCPCGEVVRFHVAKARTDHFMVCPVVDKRITRAQVDLSVPVDEDAVAKARSLFGDRFG